MTALRLHRRRVAGVAALAFTSALALVARVASAADDAPSSVARARPFDAPDTASDAPTPPLPPGYQLSESNGLRFHYHPVVRERVASLLAKAAKIRAELSARLGLPVLGAVEIRVAPARAEMSQLAPAPVPPFATAVAFSRQRLVVMSLGSADAREPADLEATLRHELAHIALDEAVADHAIPRWVHEGFAADFSGESRASCAEALFSASMHERLVPLDGLDSQLPEGAPEGSLAFAEAVDFARFLGEPAAAPHIGDVARRVREGAAFDAALSTSFGEDAAHVELAWRKEVARRYGFLPALLAGGLLWLVVAATVVIRRLRAPRRARAVELVALRDPRSTTDAPRSRSRAAVSDAMAKGALSRRRARGDVEVPKVEHDGRWYTLH